MNVIKQALTRIPPLGTLVAARDALVRERDELIEARRAFLDTIAALHVQQAALQNERDALLYWAGPEPRFAPPGHFSSPVPSIDEVRAQSGRLFGTFPRELPGIELNEPRQLELLSAFEAYYRELPFDAQAKPGLRYYYDNPGYSYSDGIFLYCMLRHLEPQRVIEIGSGNSSCLMLDVNELHFGGKLECTFIEPYPERFLALLHEGDRETFELVPRTLQEVPLSTFTALRAGDVLFIDSTHVSKTGSDVNYLVFDILPGLAPGVHVHFHDIFYPFEYPSEWVYEGKAWNEAYLLRSFLSYNSAFEIVMFNTFLERFHEQRFAERMPLCLANRGGSIWLRRR